MGIDVNDIKVLLNSGFRYLMNTCHQWIKEHPLVSGVLLFFYLLYIFFPSIFSILFYSFPLVICTAILLGGSRISREKHPKNIKKEDDQKSSHNGASTAHYHQQGPHLQSQMSRRTFGKDKSRDKDHIEGVPRKDDPVMNRNSILEEEIMPLKTNPSLDVTTQEKPMWETVDNKEPSVELIEAGSKEVQMYAALPLTNNETVSENSISEKKHSISKGARSSSYSESDDDEPQEVRNKVVEWTEDDQRNLMDLGSSEIERNKRLENLMEKRKAKKVLSMQPRRNHPDYLGNFYPRDHHIDRVGPLMLARPRMTRNPFDLPYEPLEERPVLRGGSFEEEFFADLLKDLPFSSHEGYSFAGVNLFGQFKEDHAVKSLPCFIPKPMPPDKLGFSRFKRESDVEDNVKEEVSREDKREEHLGMKDNEEVSPSQITRDVDEVQQTEVHVLLNKRSDNGAESSSSSSSSSKTSKKSLSQSSHGSRRSARRNETSRSSERKGLTCLIAPWNKGGLTGKGKASVSSSTVLDVSSAIAVTSTKMEQRSYYLSRPRHHKHSCSIASDLQVEVSEDGSPSLEALDPSSPTDQESLVYDADVDKDANSGDEDFWGTSPHPMRSVSFGPNSRLPDIIEDNNSRGLEKLGEAELALGASTTTTLSVRSINPEESEKEVIDQRSAHGEIIESRTSVSSSSSESSDSQKHNKSQHLEEYLAGLHLRGTDSKTLEVPGTSLVQERTAEEIAVREESNGILEMDEGKDESKGTQRNKGRNHARGQSEVSKESSSASNECIDRDPAPYITDQNGHSRRIEDDESTLLEKSETEVNPKEVMADSFSTTSSDDIEDTSRAGKEPHAKSEKVMKNTIGNQMEVEAKAELANSIHEESASMEEATGEADHVDHVTNTLEDSSPKIENVPELERTREGNMQLPSSKSLKETAIEGLQFS